MRIWKKALSAGISVMLLASITASGAFAAKGTTGQSDQTDWLACTNAVVHTLATCSQVADGISTVTLSGEGGVLTGASLYVTATGANMIAGVNDFVLGGGIVTAADGATIDATDTITLRAPSAPGTATVSVYSIATATGIATLEGTLAITFTASSGLDVSAANSVVKTLDGCGLTSGAFNGTKVVSGSALPSNTQLGFLCVLVKDGNGSGVVGAVVTGTITPVGGLEGDFFGQTTTDTTDANGVAVISIWSTGLSGNATIGTSATIGGKTTSFLPVSFGFTGPVASLQLNAKHVSIAIGDDVDSMWFTAKDAAGNRVSTTGSTVVTTTLTGVGFENPENGVLWTDWDGTETSPAATATNGGGYHDLVCPSTATSGTVAVKNGTILSNAVTFYCADVADSFTVAFDKTTVAPGGTATISATVKDENGFPVEDGTAVAMIVSSGATLATTTGTAGGVATWTFLAPFNTGVATALATVGGVTGSQSAQINIGAVAPAVTSGTNASSLGATKTGTYTTATKVAALGQYQTFKLSFGAGAAGTTVGVLVATKNADGTWGAFTRLTGRVADASGNAYFWWKTSSAAWISVRGDVGGTLTNAVQGRWR